jgi:hypothetical protein
MTIWHNEECGLVAYLTRALLKPQNIRIKNAAENDNYESIEGWAT